MKLILTSFLSLLVIVCETTRKSLEEKYIDLLPNDDKSKLLAGIARRIAKEVTSKNKPSKTNIELTDEDIEKHTDYVFRILKEAAQDHGNKEEIIKKLLVEAVKPDLNNDEGKQETLTKKLLNEATKENVKVLKSDIYKKLLDQSKMQFGFSKDPYMSGDDRSKPIIRANSKQNNTLNKSPFTEIRRDLNDDYLSNDQDILKYSKSVSNKNESTIKPDKEINNVYRRNETNLNIGDIDKIADIPIKSPKKTSKHILTDKIKDKSNFNIHNIDGTADTPIISLSLLNSSTEIPVINKNRIDEANSNIRKIKKTTNAPIINQSLQNTSIVITDDKIKRRDDSYSNISDIDKTGETTIIALTSEEIEEFENKQAALANAEADYDSKTSKPILTTTPRVASRKNSDIDINLSSKLKEEHLSLNISKEENKEQYKHFNEKADLEPHVVYEKDEPKQVKYRKNADNPVTTYNVPVYNYEAKNAFYNPQNRYNPVDQKPSLRSNFKGLDYDIKTNLRTSETNNLGQKSISMDYYFGRHMTTDKNDFDYVISSNEEILEDIVNPQVEKVNNDINNYIEVLRDMVQTKNENLVKYDWLGTSIDILAAIDEIVGLRERLRNGYLDPRDEKLLNVLKYLYNESKTIIMDGDSDSKENANENIPLFLKEVAKIYLGNNRLINDDDINWKVFLIDDKMDDFIHIDNDNIGDFMRKLEHILSPLHSTIKRIASKSTFKTQNWFPTLRKSVLDEAYKEELLRILLHITTANVLDRIEKNMSRASQEELDATVNDFRLIMGIIKRF